MSQTNFLFSNKSTFYRITSLCFVVLLTATLTTSCSTSKKATTKQVADAPFKKSLETSDDKITAQQLLLSAQTQASDQAIATLTQASEKLINEGSFEQALWLSQQLVQLTQSEALKYRLALVSANGFLKISEVALAFKQLEIAEQFSAKNGIMHHEDYYNLFAEVQKRRALEISSINAKLHWFAISPSTNNNDIHSLWQALSVLSTWQLDQLSDLNPPHIEGWQQLLTYAHKFGGDIDRFDRYLTQWQRDFSAHPAQAIIKSLRAGKLATKQVIQNIAIILPLSGKQAVAGKAAQQGILAAYNNIPYKNLSFIDTDTLDWSLLNERLITLDSHFVIGPLLKENVDKYLALHEILIPSLLLNTPENVSLNTEQFILSMRPEDEAFQAATTLSRKNYRAPVLLSHRDTASQRIAQAFTQQWQLLNGYLPEVVYFEKGKKMQEQLKASLEVDLSQARIKDLKIRLKQSIDTESRNRRDIDMFYLVGSPAQTKLLKPYIDVNTSPFAKIIPVYASSRSHSSKQDSSQHNDLRNLIFTEMPWLLSSQQQNAQLAQLSKTLWPSRSDSLQRIFAMGYDSLYLVDKLPLMKQKPYIRHYGQTGILKLNSNNTLTRSLLWGIYQNGNVSEISMD
ncbi:MULTISPECIES: penicillin-binding protein activator [unclassified Colwellia]|uniref:penicillin-binding protein activator n=1 Tax=unclassified Colwellia TaxID=196834 RepID=UPI0015F54FAF|nr:MULTISPECIES: penicillin-binding protein activator [unclassified Colwellia]MBA6232525.1 penicillin-binding protein activator [Colwellia sp. MB02u-7]MBA6235334.1 penicillin-binding protein activator [Colwellia sp. MB02u-11]MBA6257843.1 penicillin-binding protein activator [Colwellia sp. MB3u-28]MBA6258476.1 penicillin-binding protein activator [Colwellia sp. MB3u-41]MBA6299384.1 penicillin-binding protein activator [Colwellia sp. MB3u-22]